MRTSEEIAALKAIEDAKPKCWFCRRKVEFYGMDHAFSVWLQHPVCETCGWTKETYRKEYFSDKKSGPLSRRSPYKYMEKAQMECGRLYTMVSWLKHELRVLEKVRKNG